METRTVISGWACSMIESRYPINPFYCSKVRCKLVYSASQSIHDQDRSKVWFTARR